MSDQDESKQVEEEEEEEYKMPPMVDLSNGRAQ